MHHHAGFMVAIFAMFLVGAAINIWRHSAGIVNSSLNGISTYWQYFRINGPIQATKTFAALLVLLFWLYHQGSVEGTIALIWPGGTPPQWAQAILVVNPATAGIFGLFFDVVEDLAIVYLKKIPGLAPFFPDPVPPSNTSVAAKDSGPKE
jgi:hypothetical protein